MTQPEVAYPGTPVLQPGLPYSLIVQTDTGISSKSDGASGLEFRIMRDSEIKVIQTQLANTSKLDVKKPAVGLALANFYRNYALPKSVALSYEIPAADLATYNLSAEAIDILTTLVQQGTRSPAVYRMLGDVYWQTGLANPAIEQYLKVVKLASAPEELEDRAEAQLSLGQIYVTVKNYSQGVRWYKQSKGDFDILGDAQRVKFLERQIQDLQNSSP